MTMPTYVQVRAVNQSPTQPTSWSPFGPATPNLIIHDYSNVTNMFKAFRNGLVDITDWPIQAPDLGTFCPNVDIWCSNAQPEFGIFQADINNHAPFLGQIMETSRPALVGSVTNTVSSAGCSVGFGQMTLNVVNIENNTQPFKDSLNTVTISNQPSGSPSLTVSDSGGSSPTGTYTFPCILAGTYLLSSTMVTGNATTGTHLGCGAIAGCTISIPSNAAASTTWNVVWNSPSTLTPTATFPNIMKALAHLIDKPEFVQHDTVLQGHASCDDTILSPAHLIQGSPCVPNPIVNPPLPGSPFPAAVLTRECSNNVAAPGQPSVTLSTVLAADGFACSPLSAYNLVDDNIGSGAVWWGVPGRAARGSVATGYSGPADIDAACHYLIAAGFTLSGGTTNTCAALAQATVGTVQPATYTHFTAPAGTHFVVLLRDDPPRAHFGQIISDTINMMFGTPNDSGTCPSPCTQTSGGTATVLYYNQAGALQPTATYDFIGPAVPIIFEDGAPSKADGWNLYTGGLSLGATPDSLFSNYHSEFASNDCGGSFNRFPSNYNFHCDPAFDAITFAGEFQATSIPTLSGSAAVFQDAALRAYDFPIGIAMYSHIQQFAELNGWNWQQAGKGTNSSLVIQKGHGTQTGFWSLLNARQLPGYAPVNPIYAPGGGNPNLIRRGISQDPDTLNPYQATTAADFEIINQVFEPLLRVNPETGGANQQVIDWLTTNHFSTFDPNELGCIPPPSVPAPVCVRGVTTQFWHLGPDLFFQDGTRVTVDDVIYSILTTRDDPSSLLYSNAAFVTNAVATGANVVQVKLQLSSAYNELNIGSIPIIPKAKWSLMCGTVSSVSTPAGPANAVSNGPQSECADPSFDPLTCTGSSGPVISCGSTIAGKRIGIFEGSGPWRCDSVEATPPTPGGTCAESSTGAPIGGNQFAVDSKILLTASADYLRGPVGAQGHMFQLWNWADYNNDAELDVLDASNFVVVFDAASTYWIHPQYSCTPSAPVVDVCAASAWAIAFDLQLTAPYGGGGIDPSTQLAFMDPQIDPYSMQLAGTSICLYYQTTNTAATKLLLLNCGDSHTTSLPAGHTITDSAAVLNADGTLGSVESGSVSVSGGIVTNTWSPTLVSGTKYEIRIFDNGSQIGQFYATL